MSKCKQFLKLVTGSSLVISVVIFPLGMGLAGCGPGRQSGPAEKDKAGTRKPNFVIFLVDDLGWTDLGCYGSTFYETPNIDRLAALGVRFTNAYAASGSCSPTRASILTGKLPGRHQVSNWIGGKTQKKRKVIDPPYDHFLDLEESPSPKRSRPMDTKRFSPASGISVNLPTIPNIRDLMSTLPAWIGAYPKAIFHPTKIPSSPMDPMGSTLPTV